tara:strand:- start:7041 stop:7280 length:240 start_codon:yes stop_codon:yes gene_type:complete
MKDEPITVDDYKLVSDEFFQKYDFVQERLRLGAKAEDVLKVMEALSGAVMKDRVKNKVGPFGFNKNGATDDSDSSDTQD